VSLGRLVTRGLADLRAPSYPVVPGFRRDGRGPYPLDLRPVTRSFRLGADGVVAVPGPDGRPYRNPVSVSLYALACYGGGGTGLAGFLGQAGYLRASQDAEGGWRYPVPVRRYRVAPGWYSAMAQGLAISVLLRAYDQAGQPSYLDAADAAAGLMLRPLGAGGCAHYDEAGRPFLEECPADPPGHILNGAVFAIIGLCEYEARGGRAAGGWGAEAGRGPAAAAGLRLAGQLGRYDLGYWSRYDLRFTAPASLAYHCLHISLLEVAARLLADDAFGRTAAGWRAYLRRPGYRLRAAAAKARFALGERRG
jgi:heparosan-N-sulfate-glucuronate 5-epimerase